MQFLLPLLMIFLYMEYSFTPLSLLFIVWVSVEASHVVRSLSWLPAPISGSLFLPSCGFFTQTCPVLYLASPPPVLLGETMWGQSRGCADHSGISIVYLTDAQDTLFLNEWIHFSLVLGIKIKTEGAFLLFFPVWPEFPLYCDLYIIRA